MRSRSLIIHKTIKRKTKLKRTQKKQGKKSKQINQKKQRTKPNKKEKSLNSLKKPKRTQKKQLTKRKKRQNKKHQGGSLKHGYEGGSDDDDEKRWRVTHLSAANRFGRGPSDEKRFTMDPVLEEPGSSSVREEHRVTSSDLESRWEKQPFMTLQKTNRGGTELQLGEMEVEEEEEEEPTSFFSKLMCPGWGCGRDKYAEIEQIDDGYSFSVGEMVDYKGKKGKKKRVTIADIFSKSKLPPYLNALMDSDTKLQEGLKQYAKMCDLKLPSTRIEGSMGTTLNRFGKLVISERVKKSVTKYNQELIDEIEKYRMENPDLVEIRWKIGFQNKKKLVNKGVLLPVEYDEGWVEATEPVEAKAPVTAKTASPPVSPPA